MPLALLLPPPTGLNAVVSLLLPELMPEEVVMVVEVAVEVEEEVEVVAKMLEASPNPRVTRWLSG